MSLSSSPARSGPFPAQGLPLRESVLALLQWQLEHREAAAHDFAAPELQAFAQAFGAGWTAQQQAWWARSLQLLSDNIAAQPQTALHGAAVLGPVSYDLAALLRDPVQPLEEEQELDGAIRWWEQARKSGLIDAEDHADFGEFWRQLEWTGLQRHLAMLGQGVDDDTLRLRLLALAVKVSTRYIQLSPLTQLLQGLQGGLTQTGFSLR